MTDVKTDASFWSDAMMLSLLLPDDSDFDYLMDLMDHTEAYREQAAFCWIKNNAPALRAALGIIAPTTAPEVQP